MYAKPFTQIEWANLNYPFAFSDSVGPSKSEPTRKLVIGSHKHGLGICMTRGCR